MCPSPFAEAAGAEPLGQVLLSALVAGDGDGVSETSVWRRPACCSSTSTLSTMTYSRSNESEADEVGLSRACRCGAGGACRGDSLQNFFRKLDGGQQGTAWHSTHPAPPTASPPSTCCRPSTSTTPRHIVAVPMRSSSVELRAVVAPSQRRSRRGGRGALVSLGGALASMILRRRSARSSWEPLARRGAP